MNKKLLLQDLTQGISNRTSLSKKDSDNFLRAVFDIIIQYLQEDRIVKIKGLGTFKIIEVSGRDSVNVNTGERIHISGHSKITFTPDAVLRDQVNKPFVDFETIVINDGIDISEMERLPENMDVEDSLLDDTPDDFDDTASDQLQPVVTELAVQDETNMLANNSDEPTSNEAEIQVSNNSDSTADTVAVTDNSGCATENVTDYSLVDEVETVTDSPEVSSDESSEILENDEIAIDEPPSDEILNEETPASLPEEQTVVVAPASSSVANPYASPAASSEPVAVPKEKVVYVEQKSNWFSQVCFILLTLALMALSYLAGVQQWFCNDSDKHVTEKVENKAESNTRKTDVPAKKDSVKSTASTTVQDTPGLSQVTTPDVSDQPSQTNGATTSVKTSQNNDASTPGSSVSSVGSTSTNSSTNTQQTNSKQNYPDGKYEIVGTRCTHTVKSGEGLYRLARMYYGGNMNMATYIIKHNHITNPDLVSEGTVLNIPELKRVQ